MTATLAFSRPAALPLVPQSLLDSVTRRLAEPAEAFDRSTLGVEYQ